MTFDLDKCVGHITKNAIKQIAETFDFRLRDLSVTRVQWIAMYYIFSNNEISQKALSERMQVTASSIGRLLDRLEREKMVVRVADQTDRRVTMVALTELGKERMTQLIPIGENYNKDLTRGIHENDLIIFQNVLEKMLNNIKVRANEVDL